MVTHISYPVTIPKFYAIASEVATMRFLRFGDGRTTPKGVPDALLKGSVTFDGYTAVRIFEAKNPHHFSSNSKLLKLLKLTDHSPS